MTKPISRKMAVDCLLWRFKEGEPYWLNLHTKGRMLKCICGEPIDPGADIQFDHIHADVFDGPHQYANLRPLHAACHREKTKRDIAANAKIKRILADKPSKRPMKSSGQKLASRPFGNRNRGFKSS